MKLIRLLLLFALFVVPVLAHDVSLGWNAGAPVSGVTVAGYNVYHGTKTGGPYTKANTSLVTAGVTFDDTTVQGGTKYFYVVTAVSTTGAESGFSTEVSATVPLNAPTGLGGHVTILIKPYGDQNENKADDQHPSRNQGSGGGRQRYPQPVVPGERTRREDC